MKILLIIAAINITPIYSQGLLFNEVAFNQREKLEILRSDKVEIRASIKDYCPNILLQRGATCVALSIANARTILFAKEKNIRNQSDISAVRFSPYWVYIRNREEGDLDCSKGLDIERALDDLQSDGLIGAENFEYPKYYPFTEVNMCGQDVVISEDMSREARKYIVSKIYTIHSLDGIKVSLGKGVPVIIGMVTPASLVSAYGDDIWTPKESDINGSSFLHAVVIVGFDDSMYGGSVQIMNSWGEKWGKEGFIWISYEDMLKYTLGAYVLEDQ
jgi:hypothetical protein